MRFVSLLIVLLAVSLHARAQTWSDVEARARGQVVYFNAWGGSPSINAYIETWAREAESRYGVQVRHVKVDDIATVITGIQTAKLAGRDDRGSVDVLWINGENFARMKREGLLGPSFVESLPSAKGLDLTADANRLDFSIPTDGQEAPWGRAQLVFIHDQVRVPNPPQTLADWVAYARQNPGRLTYPEPPNFHGTTFLKQAVLETTEHANWLAEPYQTERFDAVTANVWPLLDALHPVAWRQGLEFPDSAEALMELFADGVLDLALSFNPNDASARILDGRFPNTVRTYVHANGTIGNTHFLAIPFNAQAAEGALVWINLLLSAEAQASKADPSVWGDPTVLEMSRLGASDRAVFNAVPLGPATLSADALGRILPEPHASWTEPLETAWRTRYLGRAQ